MVEVVEVHAWPERVVPGPTIRVWSGDNEDEADTICAQLEARRKTCGHPFHYEVREVRGCAQ